MPQLILWELTQAYIRYHIKRESMFQVFFIFSRDAGRNPKKKTDRQRRVMWKEDEERI